MSNFNIRIDLKKMKNVVFAKIDGKKCIVIPVAENPEVFVGEKGIYLSMSAIELRSPSQFGDTHLVNPLLDKKVYECMSDDQRKNLPILGNMRERRASEMAASEIPVASVDIYDDLPE